MVGLHDIFNSSTHSLINFQPACKWAGFTLEETFLNGEKLAQTQVLAWEQLGHDVMHIQNGVVGLAQSLGCEISWQEHASPWIVRRPSEEIEFFLDRVKKVNFEQEGGLIHELLKAVRILKKEVGQHVVIRSEADLGHFSLAAELIGLQEMLVQLVIPERWSLLEEFISYCCDIVYELWMEEAVLRERIIAPGFMTDPLIRKAWLGNMWIGPAAGQIDPTKETAAAQARVDGRFSTIAIESASMGYDFDQNFTQIEKEQKKLATLPQVQIAGPAKPNEEVDDLNDNIDDPLKEGTKDDDKKST